MAIKKKPVSPRQKMINLMYVVLMAMLALNISTEVLNGFSIVEESLNRTTSNSSKENESIYSDFLEQMKTNPEKVKAWFDKATMVKPIWTISWARITLRLLPTWCLLLAQVKAKNYMMR